MILRLLLLFCFSLSLLASEANEGPLYEITAESIVVKNVDFTDYDLTQTVKLIKNPEDIERIFLTGQSVGMLTGQSLKLIAHSFPNLTALCFPGDVIQDNEVEMLLKKCPQLQFLVLDAISKGSLTDDALFSCAQFGENLVVLSINQHPNFTDTGVDEISKGCSKLNDVSFSGCYNLEELFEPNFIQQMHYNGSDHETIMGSLTNKSLFSLVRNLKNLVYIDLNFNPQIDYIGVRQSLLLNPDIEWMGLISSDLPLIKIEMLCKRYPTFSIVFGKWPKGITGCGDQFSTQELKEKAFNPQKLLKRIS